MRKGYIIYRNFVIIFSFVTFFISLLIEKDQGYILIPFIPLCFTISFVMSKKIHRYSSKYNGMLLLNIFMVIKYVFAIFLICIFKNYEIPHYYSVTVGNQSFYLATLYIIIEMISIFITIELFSSRFYESKANLSIKNASFKIGPVLVCFLVISVIYMLFNFNAFIGKSQILFSQGNSLNETIDVSNFQYLLFYSMKMIIMGLFINFFIGKFEKTKKSIYVFWSYAAIIIYSFLSISTSRMNIILPFIFFVLLTRDIFQWKAKLYNVIMVLLLCVVFSIVSVYKNPWKFTSSGTSSSVLNNIVEFSTSIQEYTSGIFPTAIGIQAVNYFSQQITFKTLFNDILGSIPGISKYANSNDRIYRYHNLYALNGSSMSQIIPMTVVSSAYFTPVFCFLLVDLCIILLMFFEKKNIYYHNNFLYNYLYLYLLFVFSSCLNSNIQMLVGRIFTNFFPTFLILFLNQKVVFKKENHV